MRCPASSLSRTVSRTRSRTSSATPQQTAVSTTATMNIATVVRTTRRGGDGRAIIALHRQREFDARRPPGSTLIGLVLSPIRSCQALSW